MAFNIQNYMTKGVARVIRDAARATKASPAQRAYFTGFAKAAIKATAKRRRSERGGEHIPPFLIASITSACNLHCAGCYSRAGGACSDTAPVKQLTAEEWDKIFTEAEDLGISFILLAGGEPLLRYDVIKAAAAHPDILFPIFTNGTYMQEKFVTLLDARRNLIPIISLEGDAAETDSRRGTGVYQKVNEAMKSLAARGIAFGVSVTVTTENLNEVYNDAFLRGLENLGNKAVIYVEYVPVTEESKHLAPGEAAQARMLQETKRLRKENKKMVFISFPGDEKSSGGCVAAGRGFFHINSHGGAEPCPFSPYSDINVKDTSLRAALASPLFKALQTQGLLLDDHIGGCTLYMNREKVEAILAEKSVSFPQNIKKEI